MLLAKQKIDSDDVKAESEIIARMDACATASVNVRWPSNILYIGKSKDLVEFYNAFKNYKQKDA